MSKKTDAKIIIEPALAKKTRIAIVRTDFHEEMLISMEKKCREALLQQGVDEKNISTYVAPGSWEIPVVARKVAFTKSADAIICFGIILKGDTNHFDMISDECARAMMQISLDYGIPVANEVLGVNNLKDAEVRTADNAENKGIVGAIAALKTLQTLQYIG